MTIPIYIFALLGVVIVALLSDKYQTRSPFVITFFWIGSLGFLALLCVPHPRLPGLTYGFLFPAALGIYSPLIPLLGWFGTSFSYPHHIKPITHPTPIANNLAPSSRRAVGIALLISIGNLGGGLIGSNIFLSNPRPTTTPATASVLPSRLPRARRPGF
jgi:ABC-type Mn2+/Zn2+ transport system permease subunit